MAVYNPTKTIQLEKYQNDYFKTLNEFRRKNMFCDVTLQVNGKSFPCHRLVLMAASSYFQTMFNGNFKESNSNNIDIEQIDAEVMDHILNAIYTSQVLLAPENAYFIFKASHFLQLDGIVASCAKYITENPCIHYLIDTCLFAKIIGEQNVFNACISIIRYSLMSFSKTNIFEKIPFDVLNHILSAGKLDRKEKAFLPIFKWAKSNTCTSAEIRKLLESVKYPNSAIIAKLIVSKIDPTFAYDDDLNLNIEDSNFSIDLYLNTIDRISGAVGWSLLKLNNSFKFDKHATLSNFHPLNFIHASFCRIGTKIYCFATYLAIATDISRSNFCYELSSYVNDEKTIRKIPDDLPKIKENSVGLFGLVSMDSKILLFSKYYDSPIWVYDCDTETTNDEPKWNKIFIQTMYPEATQKNALYNVSNWLTATCLEGILYIIGGKCSSYNNTRKIIAFDRRFPTTRKIINFPSSFEYEYASACTFDGHIAISASNYGDSANNGFYIFNVNNEEWLPNVEPMNNQQTRYKLIYGDGFIYAVGNSPFIKNERYDISSNTWTNLPSLPNELPVKNSENLAVAINYVQFAEAAPKL